MNEQMEFFLSQAKEMGENHLGIFRSQSFSSNDLKNKLDRRLMSFSFIPLSSEPTEIENSSFEMIFYLHVILHNELFMGWKENSLAFPIRFSRAGMPAECLRTSFLCL